MISLLLMMRLMKQSHIPRYGRPFRGWMKYHSVTIAGKNHLQVQIFVRSVEQNSIALIIHPDYLISLYQQVKNKFRYHVIL